MQTPSIESLLARRGHDEKTYPIARRLHNLPIIGVYARTWIRATRPAEPRAQWATLPPVCA
ncbi:MAG TPA: hypothetical protein VGE23_00070 [Candidatus Paceibacterota bacterium]